MHARLNDPATHSTSDESFRPKRGQTVAARFSGDDCWYRAVVVEQAKGGDPAGVALVHFGDFGNGERLPAARLRAIDPSLAFHALPALARLCALSGVKAPGADYAADAAARLGQLAGGRPTPSRLDRARAAPAKPWDAEAEAEWLVTLGVGEHAAAADDAPAAVGAKGPGPDGATGESLPSVVSVNETLVAEGLCRADGRKDVAPPELRERLAAAQERARVDRAGMWEYGDVDSDDEEPTLAKPGAWGRRR
jgi:staphylococcal nuclease domain-containing protein 1